MHGPVLRLLGQNQVSQCMDFGRFGELQGSQSNVEPQHVGSCQAPGGRQSLVEPRNRSEASRRVADPEPGQQRSPGAQTAICWMRLNMFDTT